MTNKKNRISQRQRFESLITGVGKHFTGSLKLGNATMTLADVTKTLQAFVDALDADAVEKAKSKATHQSVATAEAAASALAKLLVGLVRATFGNDPEILADFGLQPTKARKKSPSVLVEAAKKAKATRAARHTMGSVQKQAVTVDETVAPAPKA